MQNVYTGIIYDGFVFPEETIKINEVCTINNLTQVQEPKPKKRGRKKKIKKKEKQFHFLDYIKNNSKFEDCLFKGIKVLNKNFISVNEEQNVDKQKLKEYQQEILKSIRLQLV